MAEKTLETDDLLQCHICVLLSGRHVSREQLLLSHIVLVLQCMYGFLRIFFPHNTNGFVI